MHRLVLTISDHELQEGLEEQEHPLGVIRDYGTVESYDPKAPDARQTQRHSFDAADGMEVTVSVPTYEGATTFTIYTERDADGDWRVFLPWYKDEDLKDKSLTLENGVEVTNGIAYLGAPD